MFKQYKSLVLIPFVIFLILPYQASALVYVSNSSIYIREDWVRTHQSDDIDYLANEILDYAITNYPDEQYIETMLIDVVRDEGKIFALHLFARDILKPIWNGDLDSLSAGEVASAFDNFDGSWSVSYAQSQVYRTPFNKDGQDYNFDCSDMAALLSGLATSLGLPSRMISLSLYEGGSYYSNHYFVEIYGLQTFGGISNNKWFLIDPATGYGNPYLSSFTAKSTIRNHYSINNYADRMWETEGWSSKYAGWGDYTGGIYARTSWLGGNYRNAPTERIYSVNPWGISVGTS